MNNNPIDDILSTLRKYFQRDDFEREDVNEKPPLRAELLNTEQLENYATFLASTHELSYEQAPEQLLKRLSENEEIIFKVTDLLHDAVREQKPVSPAGEWLLDNFYLIEEHIRLGKRHLPKGYSKGLPKLQSGKSAGMPRVYDIALEIISHSDGHIDIENLSGFIASYQKTSHLDIGELWAIPIMLRLALLENLSRVAARIAVDRIDADLANNWADRIITQIEKNPKDLVLTIGDMARSNPPVVSAFVAEFVRRLQLKGYDYTLPLSWVEQHLADTGFTINSIVVAESQKQAADQVSMSNSINSLRFLAKMDWREFVETMSMVEHALQKDIQGVYSRMDFYTRDQYRHAVERIAKNSELSELQVADIALELAQEAYELNPKDERKAHVGYYLIDKGVALTEKKAQMKLDWSAAFKRFRVKNAGWLYGLSAFLITILVSVLLFAKVYGSVPTSLLVFASVFIVLAASQLAISLANWYATLWVAPKQLPRMNYIHGIPNENRTLVVVPTLIADETQVERLVEDLEVRFLANRDVNLLFGLLTDFKDAAAATLLPQDDLLVGLLKKRIQELNHKYGRQGDDTFFLFHRPRLWNPLDKVWMGYERKRGKLGELNHVLRGMQKDRFSVIVGEEQIYTSVRYVITLDTDTQLPREAAWKLIGIMAHPLNKAVYNEKKKIITEGYGIIQPRLAIRLHGATRSLFTKMHENDAGIDPYTRLISEVYQDVFGEGSYIGKGIYDIDAFEKVTNHRFPENRILSHDLIEGAYTRCGYASDVQLYEDHPSAYSADALRKHRWIRGDWQVGAWALPFVPNVHNKWEKNPLNALSKWKIFDNLRRSLMPFAYVLLLVLGWTTFQEPWFWTFAVILLVLLPSMVNSFWSLMDKPKEVDYKQHIRNVVRNTSKSVIQSLFVLAILPYEAYLNTDAILRTLWRMWVSNRKLLEWNPSGFVVNGHKRISETLKAMWVVPLFAIGLVFLLNYQAPVSLWVAWPFIAVWFVSPVLVWYISRSLPSVKQALDEDQKLVLRELSRKTWAFFEDLVGAQDNWLPPDNIQQYPIPVVAHRTSPTNIGLSLLSNLAAKDFGYVTTSQFLERTQNTFTTLGRMERYEGHFYNWYDTQSLSTLYPRYISTVDSGNFAGHLITLRQGLLEIPSRSIIEPQLWDGLQDTLRIMGKLMLEEQSAKFAPFLNEFEEVLDDAPESLVEIKRALQKLQKSFAPLSTLPLFVLSDINDWMQAFGHQLTEAIAEIDLFAPWLNQPEIMASISDKSWFEQNLSLEDLHTHLKKIPQNYAVAYPQAGELAKSSQTQLMHALLRETLARVEDRIGKIQELAKQCLDFADIAFDFLYDRGQHLLSIGYNIDHNRRDDGFYDLLASEARLSSFVGIAQGKLPQESWFALGRRLTVTGSTPVLLSWSGSMFEYLMPNLVMPTYENTLLDETLKGSVKRQIEHGKQQGIPWGMSESCYNVVDAGLTYQYRAFGVPGLGFKRGLGLDLVIAPYATVMALMVDPYVAYTNLEKLEEEGFMGKYGYYEAVDYTPSRLPKGKSKVVIQTFMAHHQGMGFLSLAYLLLDQPMQKRFEADTQFQTALLLLQERVPKTIGYYTASAEMEDIKPMAANQEIRVFNTAHTPAPEVQLLSNGKYHVMVTNSGSGYSRWKDLAVTRWREDTTSDHWGSYCYVRSLKTNDFWSTTHQPTLKKASQYSAVFLEGRAEFTRVDHGIETHTEIIVSPEDDIEIRRVKITNKTNSTERIEITTYAEVVLASAMADDAHPGFSNLFVQTEILENQHALLCTRRPRSDSEHPPWMTHQVKVTGGEDYEISYETDRSKFIGRGNTLEYPEALKGAKPLTNSQGSVLDPIVSIRYSIKVAARESIIVDIITGIAENRDAGQLLIHKYQDRHLRDRAFELSFTHAQVVLRQINASEADAQLFNKLASPVIYANPMLRASQGVITNNQKGQSGLWSYSISGDLPIVLLQVSDSNNISLVKQLMQARGYWQLKGLIADLVILNEDPSGYRQVLQEQIQGLIAAGIGLYPGDKQGGIFVRSSDQIPAEDRILLQTVARVIIKDGLGSLADQLNRRSAGKVSTPKLLPSKKLSFMQDGVRMPSQLKLYNGIGGFTQDGKEYIIYTDAKQKTPLPWSNVIANRNFGTIVTESGSSYTWGENAHSYRLSPWHNDTVKDVNGEAIYIRDEESGDFWSPSPLPAIGRTGYVTRHGFGYTVFEHLEDGIASELWVYVDVEASIKFMVLKVKNKSGRYRKLTATGYVEWVLGTIRARTGMYTITEKDANTGAIIAKNSYNTEFPNQVSFFCTDEQHVNYTADRNEFIGRNGTLQRPEGMLNTRLLDTVGAGLDACTAIRVPFDLDNGHEKEIVFKLGTGKNVHEALHTVHRFKGRQTAEQALQQVHTFWNQTLGAVQIQTPDLALNLLANGWLVYQVLSCRLWGRSGFYQSGGAFGFRDQLQDVLSLIHAHPSLTRQQILLSASRQFPEGDVQHWWHPPFGRGVRTLCSDDYLWLPFAVSRYTSITGDTGILDENISFIEGRKLNEHEESYYDLPIHSELSASLYEHCKRSIIHGLRFGVHGLPLIGSGDWNDGMNMVGIEGKGESIWLAWFLYDVLKRFSKISQMRKDTAFAELCLQQAEQLKQNLHRNAWDGDWYVRAYFDDGTPLGSHQNTECTIDAISQSWSVLSEAGDPQRALLAMESVNKHLVNRQKNLIQLLDPPFDKSDPDPGYIRGYVPGVRENGGQYTHAAIWTVMAFAKLGNKERTWELLQMINPVNHGVTEQDVATYKVEPYVMAADVYGVSPHTGRGGWTWYTGSAGWMYTLILESFLGLKRQGNQLYFEPCVPEDWTTFTVNYRYHSTVYHIEVLFVTYPSDTEVVVDGVKQNTQTVPLVDDSKEHWVTFKCAKIPAHKGMLQEA